MKKMICDDREEEGTNEEDDPLRSRRRSEGSRGENSGSKNFRDDLGGSAEMKPPGNSISSRRFFEDFPRLFDDCSTILSDDFPTIFHDISMICRRFLDIIFHDFSTIFHEFSTIFHDFPVIYTRFSRPDFLS